MAVYVNNRTSSDIFHIGFLTMLGTSAFQGNYYPYSSTTLEGVCSYLVYVGSNHEFVV